MRTRFILNQLSVLLTVIVNSGCDFESTNNLKDVPDFGLFIYLEANRHQNSDVAQVAAAVFDDGKSVNLVGGDVFKAFTDSQSVLLKYGGYYPGSYSNRLPVSDLDPGVQLTIVHEPIQAREDRWYPIDLINVDPGPGEMAGISAATTFPPPVVITSPVAATSFNNITDSFQLIWNGLNLGDTMRVRAATTCDNGLNISTYGTEFTVGDDDGTEVITVDNFIFDIASPNITYLVGIGVSMLQQILNDLSVGNADPDFFASRIPANPIESNCEIRLFLFRQREATFDTTFDSGSVIGSTSAEVILNYSPVF